MVYHQVSYHHLIIHLGLCGPHLGNFVLHFVLASVHVQSTSGTEPQRGCRAQRPVRQNLVRAGHGVCPEESI